MGRVRRFGRVTQCGSDVVEVHRIDPAANPSGSNRLV